jgi:hypothetical protein
MKMRRLSGLLAIVVIALCGQAWAQQQVPLAEVARREAERRKTVNPSGKVYTNSDAKGGNPLTTAAATTPKSDASVAGATPEAEKDKDKGAGGETRDEAWWHKRMSDLRDALNRNRLFADALQSRINALWADYTSRDDPAQRSALEKDRTEALAELERVKGEIAKQEQAIADAEEEARKENVPPGWLR